MRTTPLQNKIEENGISYCERCGVNIPQGSGDLKKEYNYIRSAVGVTDFSFMQKYRIPEEEGPELLEKIFPGNVSRLRFGRILHTFLADEDGKTQADCYIANDDDYILLFFESLLSDEELKAVFERHDAFNRGLEDITGSEVVLSVDGPKSWELVKKYFSADVLGLPYLSIERYDFNAKEVKLIRGGKTGEFGYMVSAPLDAAKELFDSFAQTAVELGGGLCGCEIHNTLRLDGRFFNIFSEGVTAGDPLELGLQWMIDFKKKDYRGAPAILKRRSGGLKNKIIGFYYDGDDSDIEVGTPLYSDGTKVAKVKSRCYSYTLDKVTGLALLPVEIAYPGLEFSAGSPEGNKIHTISMPPFTPASLSIKLDEM